MGIPVVVVTKNGMAVTEAANGRGVPVTVAANGYGMPVVVVASGGMPVVGSGGGGGAATSLPKIGNLVFKLSADSLALADGANVTSWVDSQNSIAAATVVGTGPVFKTNQVGSKPSVRFGGAGNLNIATPGALRTAVDSQTYTVLVAAKTISGGGIGAFNTVFAASAGGNSFMFYSDGVTAGRYDGASAPFAAQYAGTSFFSFGTISNIAPSIASLEARALNGTIHSTNTTLSPGSGSNTFSLGALSNTVFAWNGDLFEVMVWNVALSPAEYMQAEMWLREKYALSYPWAALAKLPVFFGDSLTNGTGVSSSGGGATPVANTPAYLAAQALGLTHGQYQALGIGGLQMDQMTTLAPTYVVPIAAQINKPITVVCFEWANQRDSTTTKGALMLAALKAGGANIKTVFGTSTSASLYDPNANRAAYNSAWHTIGTGVKTNIDAYMPIHLDTHIGVDGSYATYSSAGDGLHLVNATYPYLATLFVNGINAVP